MQTPNHISALYMQVFPRMKLSKDNTFNLISDLVSVESIWSKHKTHAHVAVLIKRGKIIATASNAIGSRSKGAGYASYTIHAERAVIKKVGDVSKLNGATLVVIRIMKGTHGLGNSEPCHSCRCHLEKCMREHGLRSVYYSV
jgi:cytidine deaminase